MFKRAMLTSLLMLVTFCFEVYAGDPSKMTDSGNRKVVTTVRMGGSLPNPVLFVTQVPIPADFTTIGSTFGNHLPSMAEVGRGGDLMLLFPDGTLKNLTLLAGFGNDGFQGSGAIAVRDPHVHWSGAKAVFSMVTGAPEQQFVYLTFRWQLYEVTGLGLNDTPVITKVPNQPENFNNVQPIYGSDDQIIFVSDRPRNGAQHLYPQLDEYEEAPTPTGLWRLNPNSGTLRLMNHTPSGAFTPFLDSEGRVIFTRWDHLQRDQQADADETGEDGTVYGTFNYADESEDAARIDSREEVFPEPRSSRQDLLAGTNLEGHSFNRFFPWQINEDGTEEETLNHIGRHELVNYFNRSTNDDNNMNEFIASVSGRTNPNPITNFFMLREDPTTPGLFYGIDAPEFSTHTAGQIIRIQGDGATNPDDMIVDYITHRDTAEYTGEGENPSSDHSGHYRRPTPLTDGQLIAVHTAETRADRNEGDRANPLSRYDFRLKFIQQQGGVWRAGAPLTNGINKNISYYDPDVLVAYNGPLWEMSPVEVVPRPRPVRRMAHLPGPEAQVFTEEGVTPSELRDYMQERNLALVVSRDVTTRDQNDQQQPFNLRILGTATQTLGANGPVYDVRYMQFFQADQIRGIGGLESPRPGRRPLAQAMHDPAVDNPPAPDGPQGSVILGEDGSMAAFVPARRAMSWQLTDAQGEAVVRERFWLTFQPGEVRVCASCHGINKRDQADQPPPNNPPAALRDLLRYWKSQSCTPGSPDTDQNGRHDIIDAVLMVNAVNINGPSLFDLNCDGSVNQSDLIAVFAGWLQ